MILIALVASFTKMYKPPSIAKTIKKQNIAEKRISEISTIDLLKYLLVQLHNFLSVLKHYPKSKYKEHNPKNSYDADNNDGLFVFVCFSFHAKHVEDKRKYTDAKRND